MKKKYILIITLILGITLLIGTNYVKADSGWDYDYDSGGSWDSGGWDYDNSWDYDNDHDSDYNYSGSGEELFTAIIIIIVILVYAITNKITIRKNRKKTVPSYYQYNTYPNNNSVNKAGQYSKLDESIILSKLGITSDKFEQLTFDIYKNIQNAWTEFDYKKLRKYTTDEIYNSYTMQLDTLKLKNQKNIMNNIECLNVKVYNIKEENNILSIDVYLNIRMYDYVVNDNNQVVRGTSRKKANIEYELTLVRSNKNIKKDTICPNCGAKVNATTGGKCEYCGSVMVVDAKDFVLSRKKCINQKLDN